MKSNSVQFFGGRPIFNVEHTGCGGTIHPRQRLIMIQVVEKFFVDENVECNFFSFIRPNQEQLQTMQL